MIIRELSNNKEDALRTVCSFEVVPAFVVYYIPDNLLQDRDFILKAIELCPYVNFYECLPEELQYDKEIGLKFLETHRDGYYNLHSKLKKDKEIILKAIKNDARIYNKIPDEFKKDKEIVLAAVKNRSGFMFSFAPNELKNDKEFVFEAFTIDPTALESASKEIKSDKEFMLKCVKKYPYAIFLCRSSLNKNEVDQIAKFKNECINLEELVKTVSLNEEIIYQSVVGFMEEKINKKFQNICDNYGIGFDDQIPEDIEQSFKKIVCSFKKIIETEREVQKSNENKRVINEIENIKI